MTARYDPLWSIGNKLHRMEPSFFEHLPNASIFLSCGEKYRENFIDRLNGHMEEEGQLNGGRNNLHLNTK